MPPVADDFVVVAFAVVRRAAGRGGGEARELLAQDHVDHARHGVGAVDRGRAVLQHLDALDRVERELREVGIRRVAVVGQAEVREPAAVDEHEGVVGTQAAQRHGGAGGREAVGERRGDAAVVVRGDLADDVRDRLQTGRPDVLARDRLDRRGGLSIDALDVRTGHVDLDVLRHCGTASDQCDSADAQRDRNLFPLKFHVKTPRND